jgi:hypothetical protein
MDLAGEFAEHQTVNHSIGEYARCDIHSNPVESYFGILKRGFLPIAAREATKAPLCIVTPRQGAGEWANRAAPCGQGWIDFPIRRNVRSIYRK